MITTVRCEYCDAVGGVSLDQHKGTPGIHRFKCVECGLLSKILKVKAGRSNSQRRSQDQEKRAAKRYGGRTQPGSGASWREKSDFKETGRHRGECKCTIAASFSLKLAELLKLEKEAAGMETPLFEVEFQGVSPKRRYVIIRAEDYVALRDGLEQSQK